MEKVAANKWLNIHNTQLDFQVGTSPKCQPGLQLRYSNIQDLDSSCQLLMSFPPVPIHPQSKVGWQSHTPLYGYLDIWSPYPVYTSLHSPTHITCHTFEHWFGNFGTICTEDDGDQHSLCYIDIRIGELNTKVTSTSDPEEILFLKRLKVCLGLIANCN